ncbi:hypothetical protein [Haloarcula vallismortis]|uniref:hypothetical protein n=1 Tax=Haloarcula vallismortis TaxID=28442 RepID=UPI000323877C|nr:hypothetical protein [Haloarcula vallismortis]
MPQRDDDAHDLTPQELDHTHLPDQTMYKITLSDAAHFEQGGDAIRTYPVCVTNEFKLLYFEMDRGAVHRLAHARAQFRRGVSVPRWCRQVHAET